MFKNIFSMAMLLAAVVFMSCSDDSTSANNNNTNTEGIFNIQDIDKYFFAESKLDSLKTESETVTGAMENPDNATFIEKSCIRFDKMYDDEGDNVFEYYLIPEDKNTFSVTSNSINGLIEKMSMSITTIPVNLPFELPSMWVKVGDRLNDSWDIYSKEFTDFSIINGVKINGNLTVKGKKGEYKDLKIGENTHKAQQYIITFSFAGTTASISSPLNLSFNLEYYFVKGCGLMMYQIPYNVFDLVGMAYPVPGFRNKVTFCGINTIALD